MSTFHWYDFTGGLPLTPNTTPTETRVPTITPTPLPTEITDVKGVQMRLVSAGTFKMGTDNGSVDEKPAHDVYLDSYYLDTFEVTNRLYKACVKAGRCNQLTNTSSRSRSSYYGNSQYDDYPVIYVNCNMARTYCEWRGAQLPTEAQWEKAARGTDGRTYPWGEEISCSKANYYTGSAQCTTDTTPVDSYESGISPYGIYNMARNVAEWIEDWYLKTFYQNSPLENPNGPGSGQYRVLRGGSFTGYGGSATVATSAPLCVVMPNLNMLTTPLVFVVSMW